MIFNKKIYLLLLLAIISFSCSDLAVEQPEYTNDDVVVYFNIEKNSNYFGPGYIRNIQTIGESHISDNQIENAIIEISTLAPSLTTVSYNDEKGYYINEKPPEAEYEQYNLNAEIDGNEYTSTTTIPGDFNLEPITIENCWECNDESVTVSQIEMFTDNETLDNLLYNIYPNLVARAELAQKIEDDINVSDVTYYNDDEALEGIECYTESFASVPLFSIKIPEYPDNTSMFKITTIALNDNMENSIQDTSISANIFKNQSYYDEESDTYYRPNPYAFNLSGYEDICIQDGSSIINLSWLFFNYYGPHIIVISAMDENSGDYFEGDPLGFNPYIAPNSNINNGYGLFSSSRSKFFFVNVLPD